MTETYRAHYLLTSLAVVKRTCDQSKGMWVRVQDENTAIIFKRMANYQDHKCKRYVDTYRNKLQQTQNEKKRKFKPETINVNSMQQL